MTQKYWCYPTLHSDPIWDSTSATGFWLVTHQDCRAPGPGNYTSWDACSAVCEGIDGAGATFYSTEEASYPAWHARCRRGEHAHPPEPTTPVRKRAQAEAPPSSATASSAVPNFDHLHFAVRGGEVIYSKLDRASEQYLRLADAGENVELLATHDYYKALFFARGDGEYEAEQHAIAERAQPGNIALEAPSILPCGAVAYSVSPKSRARLPTAPEPLSAQQTPTRIVTHPIDKKAAGQQTEQEREEASKRRLAVIEATMKGQEASRAEASRTRLAAIAQSLETAAASPSSLAEPTSSTSPSVYRFSTPSKKPVASGSASTSKKALPSATTRWSQKKAPVAAADGYETDDFYAPDEDLATVYPAWVDEDERFDPRFQNRPAHLE
ncbi:hypothetical protein C8F04DRAFT_1248263 [Mycena alexandri]|uniref:Uncharacterized protein n=1 Tax=Mycena alexandri TaxID=1745969 RepID=A0AAD6XB79_9AGAR|nr:hypothetical protein C8F04DRAFT_1248263 [Mycena alexandri]